MPSRSAARQLVNSTSLTVRNDCFDDHNIYKPYFIPYLWTVIAGWLHPIPSRTRKLSNLTFRCVLSLRLGNSIRCPPFYLFLTLLSGALSTSERSITCAIALDSASDHDNNRCELDNAQSFIFVACLFIIL